MYQSEIYKKISQNEAFRRYGRRFIEELLKNGKIRYFRFGEKPNCKKYLYVWEIEREIEERNICRNIIRL